MRIVATGVAIAVLVTGMAHADPRASVPITRENDLSITRPAPVPGVLPDRVSPADRVAGAGPGGQAHEAGPANGTPFSSSPAGLQPDDDTNGPHSRELSGQTDSPNLAR